MKSDAINILQSPSTIEYFCAPVKSEARSRDIILMQAHWCVISTCFTRVHAQAHTSSLHNKEANITAKKSKKPLFWHVFMTNVTA